MNPSVLLAFAPMIAPPPQGSPYQLNEIHARLDGLDDQEFIELRVPGGAALDGIMILVVDGEALQAGILDLAVALEGLQAPADGYFVLGSSTVPNVDLALGDVQLLENGTQTIYLVETNDIGAIQALVGLDVDPNSDFQTDLPGLATIHDSVALIDEDVAAGWDTAFDDAPSFGPSDGKIPSGIFRANDEEWCGLFLDAEPTNSVDQPRSPGMPNQLCPRGELHPLDPRSGDRFGAALAVHPDGIAVGAPGRQAGEGRGFFLTVDGEQLFEFSRSVGAREYGRAIAVDGNRVLIGSSVPNLTGGGAHVYDLTNGDLIWSDGFNTSPDQFGRSVDLEGDTLVISGLQEVFVYDFPFGSPQYTLTGSGNTTLGSAVAISNGLIAVGASNPTGGLVLVYEAATGNLVRTLVASDNSPSLGFGGELAADGDELLVGTLQNQGVYLFDLATGTEIAKFGGPQPGVGGFGQSFDIQDGQIVLGSPSDPVPFSNGGSITVIESATGQVLLEWFPSSLEPQDRFGEVVATDGTTIIATSAGDQDHGQNSGTVFALGARLGSNYCSALDNSTGSAGRVHAFGSARVSANDLVLTAAPLPADQPGLFVYGASATSVPFGDGVRCVGGPPLSRLQLRTVRNQGYLQHTLDNTAPPTAAGQVTAGSTWYFQAWFRDPAAGGSGFNLSDGLELTFQP